MDFDLISKAVKTLQLPTVDYHNSSIKVIPAQKGDANSRCFLVKLFDERGDISLEHYRKVVLNATLPDGTSQSVIGEIDKASNTAMCKLASSMISQPGKVSCDVLFTGNDSSGEIMTLTSHTFYVLVSESQAGDDPVEGSDEYTLLVQLMNEIPNVVQEEGTSETAVMSQKATTLAIENVANSVPSDLTQTYYYASFDAAVTAINAQSLSGSLRNDGDCECAVYKDINTNNFVLTLLKNIDVTGRYQIKQNLDLNLNGHKMHAPIGETTSSVFGVFSDASLTIIGTVEGSGIDVELPDTYTGKNHYFIANFDTTYSKLIVRGGTYKLHAKAFDKKIYVAMFGSNCGFVDIQDATIDINNESAVAIVASALNVAGSSETVLKNNKITVVSHSNAYGYYITDTDKLICENNTVTTDAPGNEATQACAIGGMVVSTVKAAYLNNEHLFGTFAGLQIRAEKSYINGGVYKGNSHGGIYYCGSDSINYISNAEVGYVEYTGVFDFSKFNIQGGYGSFYIGGSSDAHNIQVYMDNCTLTADQSTETSGQDDGVKPYGPVLRGASGEHDCVLYISNTLLPENKSLRVDPNNSAFVGEGTNITIDDISYSSAFTEHGEVTFTDFTYREETLYTNDKIGDIETALDTKADKMQVSNAVQHTFTNKVGKLERIDGISPIPQNFNITLKGNSTQESAPALDAPVEVISISNPTLSIYSKNLIPYPYQGGDRTVHGVAITQNEDGSLTLNGQVDKDVSTGYAYYNNENVPVFTLKKGTAYRLSCDSIYMALRLYTKDSWAPVMATYTDAKEKILTPDKDIPIYRILGYFFDNYKEAVIKNHIIFPMLEILGENKDYEPYKLQSVTIPLTLAGQGNYKDEIVVDQNTRTVKHIQKYYKYQFTGNETWTLGGTAYDNTKLAIINPSAPATFTDVRNQISNTLPVANMYSEDKIGIYGYSALRMSKVQIFARIPHDKNFNDVLNSEVYLWYPLRWPIETDYTNTEWGQRLLNLTSCGKTLTVVCDAELTVDYNKDVNYALEEIIAEPNHELLYENTLTEEVAQETIRLEEDKQPYGLKAFYLYVKFPVTEAARTLDGQVSFTNEKKTSTLGLVNCYTNNVTSNTVEKHFYISGKFENGSWYDVWKSSQADPTGRPGAGNGKDATVTKVFSNHTSMITTVGCNYLSEIRIKFTGSNVLNVGTVIKLYGVKEEKIV